MISFSGREEAADAAGPQRSPELAKTGRLWLLALICATVGSITVWRTNNLGVGVLAFLVTLALLGAALWTYERRRK